ncbi:MAG TPA: fibronectin type III domain-containing protein [Candidatus Ozemobacteraceae bacterium]|nr:fibronectin type III domain-containing protein [Candidatus Ozemobacteraceae bacterium]
MDIFRRVFIQVAVLIGLTALISGCGGTSGSGDARTAAGLLTGTVPASLGSVVLIRGADGSTQEAAVDAEGRYAASVKPGAYSVLLKTADGNLSLISRSVSIEDNMTVSLLDIRLVPLPQVVSVSVPLVDHDTATVEWLSDIEADGRIEYGTDTRYGFSTYTDTELKIRHRMQLYDLRPDTTYHFRIVASRHGLETTGTLSKDYAFTTAPAPDTQP